MRKLLFIVLLSAPFIKSGAEIVIDKNTVWEGKIEISDKIELRQKATLKVKPDTEVIFKGGGQLICEGAFSAEKALFKADSVATGFSRMEFAGKLDLKNSCFKNIVTEDKRYHNAFLSVRGGVNISSCTFENCSAVELVRTKEASVLDCIFYSPVDNGLVIFHSVSTVIENNVFQGGDKTSVLLKLNSAEGTRIKQNRFSGKGIGTYFYGTSKRNILCINSYFDNTKGIEINVTSAENLIFSCLFDGNSQAGIKIMGGIDNLIRNCVFYNCPASGILIPKFHEPQKIQASVKITNTAIISCGAPIICQETSFSGEITRNSLWQNKKNIENRGQFKIENNIHKNPLFVSPENGNFRLRSKNFGYEEDSPLLKAGFPEGTSIGLFPASR